MRDTPIRQRLGYIKIRGTPIIQRFGYTTMLGVKRIGLYYSDSHNLISLKGVVIEQCEARLSTKGMVQQQDGGLYYNERHTDQVMFWLYDN